MPPKWLLRSLTRRVAIVDRIVLGFSKLPPVICPHCHSHSTWPHLRKRDLEIEPDLVTPAWGRTVLPRSLSSEDHSFPHSLHHSGNGSMSLNPHRDSPPHVKTPYSLRLMPPGYSTTPPSKPHTSYLSHSPGFQSLPKIIEDLGTAATVPDLTLLTSVST